MKLCVWNDIHKDAPNEIVPSTPINFGGAGKFCIGDIYDRANCAKDQIERVTRDYLALKKLFDYCWIDGNHEVNSVTNDIITVWGDSGKVVLAHGDFESWGADKAIAYRKQTPGASAFKRSVIVPAIERYEQTVGRTVSAAHAQRCVELAKANGCTIYIGGHLHPKERFEKFIDGVRVIVLMRGYNEVHV